MRAIKQTGPRPATFTIAAVEAAAIAVGVTVTRNAIQSQMSNYAAIGLLERVAEGVYHFTGQAALLSGDAASVVETDGGAEVLEPSDQIGSPAEAGDPTQPDADRGGAFAGDSRTATSPNETKMPGAAIRP